MEVKPNLVFTVYDAKGNILRKINSPLRKGYSSVNWDLAYLTGRGPKVPPGEYKVALDKHMNGTFTRLVEPQPFSVKAIPNALGTPNYAENFNFLKETTDLNAQLTSARGKIQDMNTRLKNMKSILANTPVEANVLVVKIDAVQKNVDAVAKAIVGGFGAKNTVSSRLRFAMYTTASAHVDITGAQKEQYELAKSEYSGQEAALNDLYSAKIPALEKEFEEAGGVLFNNPPQRRFFFDE